MKKIYVVILYLFASLSPVGANDSVASLSGRNIILEKSSTIRMRKEFLHLTPEKVSVDYIFLNDGSSDIETTVAFPHETQEDNPYATRDFSAPQFNDFKVLLEGQNPKVQIKAVATYQNKDITKELEALKVPTDRFPEKLSENLLKTFIQKGWFKKSDPELQNEEKYTYTIKRTHYWTQNFIKQVPHKSHHEYSAILGGDSSCNAGQLTLGGSQPLPEVCCSCALQGRHYTYILTTGNNWKNGIEEFELLIEGASIILVKMNGLSDFDLNSYQFQKKNFKPTDELHIEYLTSKTKMPIGVPKSLILKKSIDGPANCRSNPQGKNVIELPDQAEVAIRERKNQWYRIEYGSHDCWTHRKNLRFTNF